MTAQRTLVVVGHGMVGQRLLEELVARDPAGSWAVHLFCEEPRVAYDRVHLTSAFDKTAEELSLVPEGFLERPDWTLHLGDRVSAIDAASRTVTSAAGAEVAYDALVLATGSYPFVPPLEGKDSDGCFVYRTIEDVEGIRERASRSRSGAVIGGGLLGLEAADALRRLGVETHVVEFAPRLMPLQVDDAGGALLRSRIEELGLSVHTGMRTSSVLLHDDGTVRGLAFEDEADLEVDMVVFSAGIRPRDELARDCGLDVGERGGVVVDDTCRTSDPHIFAIGEVAAHAGRVYGLVAPGYEMATVVADQLCGGSSTFTGADLSTKLKLLGVDVASFGDSHGAGEGSSSIVLDDPIAGTYKRLVLQDGQVTGGILVGDADAYMTLLAMSRGFTPTPENPLRLLLPAGDDPLPGLGCDLVCSCNNVTSDDIELAFAGGAESLPEIKSVTRAGTGCGGCTPLVERLLNAAKVAAGQAVDLGICEHFGHTRQELFHILRVTGIRTFAELVAGHGQGGGCEICKPAVASMLASLETGYILDGEQASLQDTNDHMLANLQKDGTYSVVPRVPGGELTPAQLIAIGEVARDYGLYTKITGGQRIDLFGARAEQLPPIWQRLVDAGLESGHAYGKALRTVKSCVGETWCRYGVGDSTTLAIDLELRYRGLRAPHKLKMAVSGCTRECAEAQGKDVGVIATERGWNLYTSGNGGMRPRHADLFAEDLDRETLIRYIDRYLMFYIRTANRLERTSVWFEQLDGGLDYLRSVIIDDALGICDELDAAMDAHVEAYRCEWTETLADPERLLRFRSFVNTDEPDATVVFVRERDQIRPARPEERDVALPDPRLVLVGPPEGGAR